MKFTLSNTRDVIGNRIVIKIQREGSQLISRVRTVLDGSTLGNHSLATPAVQFERAFRQAGSASPGQEHELEVTATDQDGNPQTASKIWVDNL